MNEIAIQIVTSIIATLIIAILAYIYRRAITISLQTWLLKQKGVGIERVYRKRTDARPQIAKLLQLSREVRYMGQKGLDIIGHREVMYSDLALALGNNSSQGRKIQFLILDPISLYVDKRAKEINHSADDNRKAIRHTLDDVISLKGAFMDVDINIRLYDLMPIWNLLFIDDILFLGFYSKGITGPDSIYLEIRKPSGLYFTMEKYFDSVWEVSKPLEN